MGSSLALRLRRIDGKVAQQLHHVGVGRIDGSLAAKDCTVTYRQGSRKLAVLTIARDRDSLAAEIELERMIATGS